MKILLIGEYSRFHNSLKEGLVALGHEVTLVGTGDLFKKYPIDIDISPKQTTSNWLMTAVRRGLFRITGTDIAQREIGRHFWRQRHQMKGFDVVQLINSHSIGTTVPKEMECVDYLAKNNKALFLSACGTDTPWVKSLLKNDLDYHLLSPYLTNKKLGKSYESVLKYLSNQHQKLYTFVEQKAHAIIPTDMDYYLGLSENDKATSLIPTPINTSLFDSSLKPVKDKLVIFHGINRMNYIKKGNDVFEKALEVINTKYAEKIVLKTVESMPYSEYIKAYEEAHILLDQVYSHDQGYNALEAMAKGKVVFTGAGSHFQEFYKLEKTVAIDATPDVEDIAEKLEDLILNPEKIERIGINAREFVKKEHDYIKVAKRYIEIWSSAL